MTPPDLHAAGRLLHLGGGFAAVGLGLAVMLLPKFGPRAAWHRRLGRLYAVAIAGSCLLAVPLAYRQGNAYLTVLGVVTLGVVLAGWHAGRVARSAPDRGVAARWLRRHLILMGASYVGAWSGFLATNPIFGVGEEWQVWLTVFAPTALGAVAIARAALRVGRPHATARPAPRPTTGEPP